MNINKNMKGLVLFLVTICMGQFVWGQMPEKIEPFATPFGEFTFKKPQFPDKTVSIVDFGAKSGGTFKNTEAINHAIQQLSGKGGGTVLVPAGKWLTGPIVLLSNINLHLEQGAELLFSQDFNDYLPMVLTNFEGSELYNYSPFIYADHQENIAITGKGVLNGQGKPWWEQRKHPEFGKSVQRIHNMNETQVPVKDRRFGSLENYLPVVFFGPVYCKHVLLEGVSFKYGAFWTINPSFCEDVIVRGVDILTYGDYGHTPNGDGINPNSCKNVLIEYNTLSTGDDCITLKSGRNRDGRRLNRPCENILIRHNTGLMGHGGIVIGSEMSGGVENVYASDCKFYGTDRVIRIKTDRGRGGYVKNCWFTDIYADTIQREAIRINMLYTGGNRLPERPVNENTPVIENINYKNIQCDYAKNNVIQILGLPEMPVRNVSFENIALGGRLGIEVNDARTIRLKNLKVRNQKGPVAAISFSDSISIDSLVVSGYDAKSIPILLNDAQNIQLNRISDNIPGSLIKITGNSANIEIDKNIPNDKIIREAKKD